MTGYRVKETHQPGGTRLDPNLPFTKDQWRSHFPQSHTNEARIDSGLVAGHIPQKILFQYKQNFKFEREMLVNYRNLPCGYEGQRISRGGEKWRKCYEALARVRGTKERPLTWQNKTNDFITWKAHASVVWIVFSKPLSIFRFSLLRVTSRHRLYASHSTLFCACLEEMCPRF